MTKKKFELNYNIDLDSLPWEDHMNNGVGGVTIKVCEIGDYCIYREDDDYTVVRDGSVWHWFFDLGKLWKEVSGK